MIIAEDRPTTKDGENAENSKQGFGEKSKRPRRKVANMENDKLIHASDARKAILKAEPNLAYLIDRIPAVDAVEVVRCKDCKYGRKMITCFFCAMTGTTMEADDFCSYGER